MRDAVLGLHCACAFFTLSLGSSFGWASPALILVNGGHNPSQNTCDFYDDIENSYKAFDGWDRSVLAADSREVEGPPNAVACDSSGRVLYDEKHIMQLIRRQPSFGSQGGATLEELKDQIKDKVKHLKKDEPLVLFFLDHGSLNTASDGHTESLLSLWSEKSLTESMLREVLTTLVPMDKKIILLHDHCYGGGMLQAIWPEAGMGQPRRGACGFSSSDAMEMSYSGEGLPQALAAVFLRKDKSIPQGIDEDGDGHYSMSEVFKYARREHLSRSTQQSTSELFLKRYLSAARTPHTKKTPILTLLQPCTPSQNQSDSKLNLFNELGLEISLDSMRKIEAQLQKELRRELSFAKIKDSTPISELEAKLSRIEEAAQKAESEVDRLEKIMDSAEKDFVAYAMDPSLYQRYLWLNAESDRLGQLLKKLLPAVDKKLESEWRQRVQEYNTVVDSVDQIKNSISSENQAFMSFSELNGGTPKHPWPKSIAKDLDAAKRDFAKKTIARHEMRQLMISFRNVQGLQEVIRRKDLEAISTYLDLWACENTSIRKVVKGK